MMAVDFSTREYRFSHGKEPRGFGGWAFEFPGDSKALTPERLTKLRDALPAEHSPRVEIVSGSRGPVCQIWVHRSTLGAAKRAVRAALRSVFEPIAPACFAMQVEVAP